MGYQCHKAYRRKDGTVRWRLIYETYKGNKRTQRIIPKSEWASIGFRTDMTLEEAKALARGINTEKNLKRQEEQRQKIHLRLETEHDERTVYLPQIFVAGFERDWLAHQDSKANLPSHWRAAMRIIKTINLHPHEWCSDPDVLFREFARRQLSISYSEKLLRVLNEWGIYISRKTNKFFIPVRAPKGKKRERIADSYFDSGKKRKKSAPLSPQELGSAKDKLHPLHHNWLLISVWFGLRPAEIDNLKKADTWSVKRDDGVEVLWVYQPKLSAVPREERWKLIPILYDEQRGALERICSGEFQRPLTKTIEKNVKMGCGAYCGRKGFHALMSGKGHRFEDISAWLGHRSLDRTWLDYVQRLKVSLPKKAG